MLAPPRRPPQDELEALIPEARARQRRRRMLGAAFVAAAVATALSVGAVLNAGSGARTQSQGSPSAAIAAVPSCGIEQLRLSAARSPGFAAGSLLERLTLTNVSHSACTLAGWPDVRRLDGRGHAVPTRRILVVYSPSGSSPYQKVRLRPGHAASFNLFGDNWNLTANRPCPTTRHVLVEPHGDSGWLSVARRIPACRTLFVAPLVAGSTDPHWWSVTLRLFRKTHSR